MDGTPLSSRCSFNPGADLQAPSATDRDGLCEEMLEHLRSRQQTLRVVLEQAGSSGTEATRLYGEVRALADQADDLLVSLMENTAADALLAAAEDLVLFYQDAKEQLEHLSVVALAP